VAHTALPILCWSCVLIFQTQNLQSTGWVSEGWDTAPPPPEAIRFTLSSAPPSFPSSFLDHQKCAFLPDACGSHL
jgi:hypothetical protein